MVGKGAGWEEEGEVGGGREEPTGRGGRKGKVGAKDGEMESGRPRVGRKEVW